MKVAMTIAGSDPSGGAGLQADLKTFHQHGVYGTSVVTLLTVQNTQKVESVEVLAPATLCASPRRDLALYAALKVRVVLFGVARPLFRHVFFGEDRGDGALRITCPAVNALVGVNVELVRPFVDAVDRTHIHAPSIKNVDTRLRNDVGHRSSAPE